MTNRFQAKKAHPFTTSTFEAYVPNRDRNGHEVRDHGTWLNEVERVVCACTGGGSTTYRAVGRWQSTTEGTWVVRGAVPNVSGRRESTLDRLAEVMGAFAEATNQELAGFTCDGEWYFAAPAEADVGQPSVEDLGR